MREIYTLVFSVGAALLGIELIVRLFPEKSGALVHALAVLAVVLALVGGLFRADWSWIRQQTPDFQLEERTENAQALYTETGTALLRQRLCALLESAGVAVSGGTDGVEVQYTKADDGVIDIERVRVCVTYATDIDRAHALLQAVLTEEFPVDVFAS